MDKVVRTGLERVLVTIHSAGGVHRFDVEVARTHDQQALGLMHRRSLGKNRGMIFPMNPPRDASFWMHDTLIPLDIIFIRADGRIERITAARPRDDAPVPSGEPVAAVLEIRGGRAEELGIRAGDRVEWPR